MTTYDSTANPYGFLPVMSEEDFEASPGQTFGTFEMNLNGVTKKIVIPLGTGYKGADCGFAENNPFSSSDAAATTPSPQLITDTAAIPSSPQPIKIEPIDDGISEGFDDIQISNVISVQDDVICEPTPTPEIVNLDSDDDSDDIMITGETRRPNRPFSSREEQTSDVFTTTTTASVTTRGRGRGRPRGRGRGKTTSQPITIQPNTNQSNFITIAPYSPNQNSEQQGNVPAAFESVQSGTDSTQKTAGTSVPTGLSRGGNLESSANPNTRPPSEASSVASQSNSVIEPELIKVIVGTLTKQNLVKKNQRVVVTLKKDDPTSGKDDAILDSEMQDISPPGMGTIKMLRCPNIKENQIQVLVKTGKNDDGSPKYTTLYIKTVDISPAKSSQPTPVQARSVLGNQHTASSVNTATSLPNSVFQTGQMLGNSPVVNRTNLLPVLQTPLNTLTNNPLNRNQAPNVVTTSASQTGSPAMTAAINPISGLVWKTADGKSILLQVPGKKVESPATTKPAATPVTPQGNTTVNPLQPGQKTTTGTVQPNARAVNMASAKDQALNGQSHLGAAKSTSTPVYGTLNSNGMIVLSSMAGMQQPINVGSAINTVSSINQVNNQAINSPHIGQSFMPAVMPSTILGQPVQNSLPAGTKLLYMQDGKLVLKEDKLPSTTVASGITTSQSTVNNSSLVPPVGQSGLPVQPLYPAGSKLISNLPAPGYNVVYNNVLGNNANVMPANQAPMAQIIQVNNQQQLLIQNQDGSVQLLPLSNTLQSVLQNLQVPGKVSEAQTNISGASTPVITSTPTVVSNPNVQLGKPAISSAASKPSTDVPKTVSAPIWTPNNMLIVPGTTNVASVTSSPGTNPIGAAKPVNQSPGRATTSQQLFLSPNLAQSAPQPTIGTNRVLINPMPKLVCAPHTSSSTGPTTAAIPQQVVSLGHPTSATTNSLPLPVLTAAQALGVQRPCAPTQLRNSTQSQLSTVTSKNAADVNPDQSKQNTMRPLRIKPHIPNQYPQIAMKGKVAIPASRMSGTHGADTVLLGPESMSQSDASSEKNSSSHLNYEECDDDEVADDIQLMKARYAESENKITPQASNDTQGNNSAKSRRNPQLMDTLSRHIKDRLSELSPNKKGTPLNQQRSKRRFTDRGSNRRASSIMKITKESECMPCSVVLERLNLNGQTTIHLKEWENPEKLSEEGIGSNVLFDPITIFNLENLVTSELVPFRFRKKSVTSEENYSSEEFALSSSEIDNDDTEDEDFTLSCQRKKQKRAKVKRPRRSLGLSKKR